MGGDDICVVGGLDTPGRGVVVENRALCLLCERRHDDAARDIPSLIGDEARLEAQHRHGLVCHDAGAGCMPGLCREARWHIDRDDWHAGGVHGVDPDIERRLRLPVEARAEHGIKDKVGRGEDLHEVLARRPDDDLDAGIFYALSDEAGKIALDLFRLDRRDDRHTVAMALEHLRCHPAVPAIVAEADKDRDRMDVFETHDLFGSGSSRTAHELRYAHALFRKPILDGLHVLHVQDWLHNDPP